MCTARLPVLGGLIGLTLTAACSSSSGAAPPSSPPATSAPATSSAATSTPTTSTPAASQTPVGLPVAASPTPTRRSLTRPAGASVVDFHTCLAPTNVVILFLQNQVFTAPDTALQLVQLKGAAQLAASERRHVEQARRVWLRDGYPAGFPMVRELDTYVDIYNKIIAAAHAKDLDALPQLYLRLEKVDAQYGADAGNRSICKQ